MRFHLHCRLQGRLERPTLLFLLLPQDHSSQRVGELRLSQPARELTEEDGGTLACFEIEPSRGLTLDFELTTQAYFAPRADPPPPELREMLEEICAAFEMRDLHQNGTDTDRPAAALYLAQLAVAAARARGWRGEVVLGHLLLSEPVPHAWCRLQTPTGTVECDLWFYLMLQEAPGYWLHYGLTPEPADYLRGHEGRRVAWGTLAAAEGRLPCQDVAHDGEPHPLLWPAVVWSASHGFLPQPGCSLEVREKGAAAAAQGATAVLRAIAFTALLLVATGLLPPGAWSLAAYSSYAGMLLVAQGRAWWRLFTRPWARLSAVEAALFQASLFAVLAGLDTVLPQALFALIWIYLRVQKLWLASR